MTISMLNQTLEFKEEIAQCTPGTLAQMRPKKFMCIIKIGIVIIL
jgi:hypothetical protein